MDDPNSPEALAALLRGVPDPLRATPGVNPLTESVGHVLFPGVMQGSTYALQHAGDQPPQPPPDYVGKVPSSAPNPYLPQAALDVGTGLDPVTAGVGAGKAALAAGKYLAGLTPKEAALFLVPRIMKGMPYTSGADFFSQAPKYGVLTRAYDIARDTGEDIGMGHLSYTPRNKTVDFSVHGVGSNLLGPREVRSLGGEIMREVPNAQWLESDRVTGAKAKNQMEDAAFRQAIPERLKPNPTNPFGVSEVDKLPSDWVNSLADKYPDLAYPKLDRFGNLHAYGVGMNRLGIAPKGSNELDPMFKVFYNK